jgi:hypothetical protein
MECRRYLMMMEQSKECLRQGIFTEITPCFAGFAAGEPRRP